MVDPDKVIFYSNYNSFKNDGVLSAIVTMSGSIPAGTQKIFTTSVTSTLNPLYGQVQARFKELSSGVTDWWNLQQNGLVVLTVGSPSPFQFNVGVQINGNTITFLAFVFNGTAGSITLQSTDVPFSYVLNSTTA